MAITPNIARKLNIEDAREVAQLEQEIDRYLAANFGKNSSTFPTFDFVWGKVPNKKVIEELIRRFKAAGWESVKHITGRDVNGLQFIDIVPETLRRKTS